MDNKLALINENNYAFIWEKVDEVVFQNTHFKTNTLQRTFLHQLVYTNLPQATIYEKKSEYYLILGYISYFCNESKSSQQTIKFLKYAIKYNKNNYLAWIYSGFWYFDNKQWSRARNAFKRIPDKTFSLFNDVLRNKITELKLCCNLYLCSTEKTICSIKNFLQNLSFQDEENRSIPVELQKAIEQAKLNSTTKEALLSLLKICNM